MMTAMRSNSRVGQLPTACLPVCPTYFPGPIGRIQHYVAFVVGGARLVQLVGPVQLAFQQFWHVIKARKTSFSTPNAKAHFAGRVLYLLLVDAQQKKRLPKYKPHFFS